MRRHAAPALVAALAALVLTAISAASSPPTLRTVAASRGHIVVTFSLGNLAPGRIRVAVRRATTPDGMLLAANVRLTESLRARKTASGRWRARTRHTLKPRVYYVQVSGIVIALDCTPKKPCPQDWSNVRRVRIPRS
jgi:hypothetical protein